MQVPPDLPTIQLTSQQLASSIPLTDGGRLLGVHIMAGKGSGKSRLMGRLLAFQDLYRGVPLVILDPNGPTINNLLDKLARRPSKEQEYFFPRIRYVDMAGSGGRIVPWPLYYQASASESRYRVAQRYLEAIKRIDPHLQTASIQGWNALWSLGTYTGIVLSTLGYQVTEAFSLLDEPENWHARLDYALQEHPEEMRDAHTFFTLEYPSWSRERKASQTAALRTKIAQLCLDPSCRAMFGAATPGIDWGEVVEKRLCVLLDFSRETSLELRRFKMLWVFLSFLAFVQGRGAGRHRPISFIVDELAGMYHTGADTFAEDMDELINVVARNYSVWLTLAHQELFQFDRRAQKTLMNMGTQIIGSTQDPEAAYVLARQFYRYDPRKVKRYRPVWASFNDPIRAVGNWHDVIDEEPIEYAVDEQYLLESYAYLSQAPFHFVVKTAQGEGNTTGAVQHMSVADLDRGVWVNESGVNQIKDVLRQQAGVPIETVYTEINARLQHPFPPVATMRTYGTRNHIFKDEDDITEKVEA